MTKPRFDIFAYALSFFIHALLLGYLAFAGFNYVVPQGSVSITTIDSGAGEQEATAPSSDISTERNQQKSVKKDSAPPASIQEPTDQIEQHDVSTKPADAKSVDSNIPVAQNEEQENAPSESESKVDEADSLEKKIAKNMEAAPNAIQDSLEEEDQKKPSGSSLARTLPKKTITEAPQNDSEDTEGAGGGSDSQGVGATNPGAKSVRWESQIEAIEGNVRPEYPVMARLKRIEGTTVLEFKVERDGSVSNVRIVKSSGSSILDESAVNAQKQWRYKPNQQGLARKSVIFRLTRS